MANSAKSLLGSRYVTGTGTHIPSSTGYTLPTFTYQPQEMAPETHEQAERRKELHKKTWIYFARLFVDRYPEWDKLPDTSHPLKNALLRSKNRDFTIENTENGIRLIGATGGIAERISKDLQLFAVTTAYLLDNRHEFYGWALGFDNVPDFIIHP